MKIQIFFFDDHKVHWQKRKHQRSIKLTVRPNNQIQITTNCGTSMQQVLIFLEGQKLWLKKVLDQFHHLRKKFPRKYFHQGEGFMYQGDYVFLDYISSSLTDKIAFQINESKLICLIPETHWNPGYHIAPQPQVHPYLMRFFQTQAKEIMSRKVHLLASQMELFPRRLSFRSQKSRWGSCSAKGHISLNWRLIAAPPAVLEYVIIHELAHLAILNHSPAFWNLVKRHCDSYQSQKKWLLQNAYEFDFLAKKSEIHSLA